MVSLSKNDHLILGCHITGVYDVNRRNTLPDNAYELAKHWADSIASLGLKGVLFHNNFTESTCKTYQNEFVNFVRIVHNPQFNPNVYRYIIYRDFLRDHLSSVKSFFVTDVSDVVVLRNPFAQPLFVDNPLALFCGDEPKLLDNEWMQAHATQLRNQIADYAQYEENHSHDTLLNCGIIGGNSAVMMPFIEKLCQIHEHYNVGTQTAYTGDMGAFNYLVRTQFNDQLVHGAPVNTVFKAYQNERMDCWFQHK